MDSFLQDDIRLAQAKAKAANYKATRNARSQGTRPPSPVPWQAFLDEGAQRRAGAVAKANAHRARRDAERVYPALAGMANNVYQAFLPFLQASATAQPTSVAPAAQVAPVAPASTAPRPAAPATSTADPTSTALDDYLARNFLQRNPDGSIGLAPMPGQTPMEPTAPTPVEAPPISPERQRELMESADLLTRDNAREQYAPSGAQVSRMGLPDVSNPGAQAAIAPAIEARQQQAERNDRVASALYGRPSSGRYATADQAAASAAGVTNAQTMTFDDYKAKKKAYLEALAAGVPEGQRPADPGNWVGPTKRPKRQYTEGERQQIAAARKARDEARQRSVMDWYANRSTRQQARQAAMTARGQEDADARRARLTARRSGLAPADAQVLAMVEAFLNNR